jgi:hypothetical protein
MQNPYQMREKNGQFGHAYYHVQDDMPGWGKAEYKNVLEFANVNFPNRADEFVSCYDSLRESGLTCDEAIELANISFLEEETNLSPYLNV